MRDKLTALCKKHRELVAYCVVGGCTTLVNALLFWLLHYIAGVHTDPSNAVSIAASVVFAYVTNKIFVFRTRCGSVSALVREAVSFFTARGVTMLLEYFGVKLLIEAVGLEPIISKGLMILIVLVLNFIFSKLFIFKREKRSEG